MIERPASAPLQDPGTTYDVVLMAFACEPNRGSEPGVGYAFAAGAARLAREDGRRVMLVTRSHRVRQIEEALGDDAKHLEIVPVHVPLWLVRLTGLPLVRIAYLWWQLKAVAHVRALLADRRERPIVVHHVTFATEALPTFEAPLRRHGAIVIGPAGSAAVRGTGPVLGARRALRTVVARSTLRSADLLVAQNHHVGRSWSGSGRRIVVEPNIVVEPLREPRPEGTWDVVCAGVLIRRKRFDIAIRAFARSRASGRMLLIGEGPERDRLLKVAEEEGVADRIDFVGAVPRTEVIGLIARSRLLLHPSRQEGAGWVVGEAHAVGTWPIVFAGSGADSPVLAAELGTVVDPVSVEAMRDAVDAALTAPAPAPSARWSADRLPAVMRSWYEAALDRHRVRAA